MEAGLDTIMQGGALAVFVYYTLQNNRDWRAYLTERNSKLEKSLDKLGSVLNEHARVSESVHQAAERAAVSAAQSASSAAQSADRSSSPSVIINKN